MRILHLYAFYQPRSQDLFPGSGAPPPSLGKSPGNEVVFLCAFKSKRTGFSCDCKFLQCSTDGASVVLQCSTDGAKLYMFLKNCSNKKTCFFQTLENKELLGVMLFLVFVDLLVMSLWVGVDTPQIVTTDLQSQVSHY